MGAKNAGMGLNAVEPNVKQISRPVPFLMYWHVNTLVFAKALK